MIVATIKWQGSTGLFSDYTPLGQRITPWQNIDMRLTISSSLLGSGEKLLNQQEIMLVNCLDTLDVQVTLGSNNPSPIHWHGHSSTEVIR